MRLFIALLLSHLFNGVVPADSPRRGPPPRRPVRRQEDRAALSGRYIIEVPEGTNLGLFSSHVKTAGARVLRTFSTPGVFTGLSVESPSDNIDSLEALPQVARAWPVSRIALEPSVPESERSDVDVPVAANYSVHTFTGVDKLHEQGIFGKGARIAVIDTGADYNHPALGGGYGPGYKIAGGFDFVGNPEDFRKKKEPDADPMDYMGHGTHVAGIIAGKNEWFTGVAPEATLYSYKVFGDYDAWTDEDTLIDAFLLAFVEGADVITASIGAVDGFLDGTAWAVVASRLVEQGVVVTISAGNSGASGPFYGSSGSSGKNVLAVASTNPYILAAEPFRATFTTADGEASNTTTTTLGYLVGTQLWNASGLPIIPTSLDTNVRDDACFPLVNGTGRTNGTTNGTTNGSSPVPDLTNAITLVRRGSCQMYIQQQHVEALNARYVLIYNDNRTADQLFTSSNRSELAMIDGPTGSAIVAFIKAGGNVTADFSYRGVPSSSGAVVGAFNPTGGIPSYYTSWGPLHELESKPDVAAPGAEIYSTYLANGWDRLSGTSMACPYVAGVAALYISRYGGRSVHGRGFGRTLTDRIRASGTLVRYGMYDYRTQMWTYEHWAPVPQVGGGQIDAFKVVNYTTTLSFDPIVLNDTAHFSRYHPIEITNGHSGPVTYNFSLVASGTFDAQSPSSPAYLASLTELSSLYSFTPEVALPSDGGAVFTVQPGETRTAQLAFSPPSLAKLNASALPIYSGKVLISSSAGESLSIPYVGAAFDLKAQLRGSMFLPSTPYQRSGPTLANISAYHTYDFSDAGLAADAFPKVFYGLKWATRQIRWDVYEAGWREQQWSYFPPVVGRDGYVGSATSFNISESGFGGESRWNPREMDREATFALPISRFRSARRGGAGSWSVNFALWWLGKLANGSYIAPGNYTIRFAALIPLSDPSHSDNWDVWETPDITVLPYTVGTKNRTFSWS